MGRPVSGEVFAQLIEHLRKAQESAAMLAHLYKDDGSGHQSRGWLAVSEMLGNMVTQVTRFATKVVRVSR